MDCKQLFAGQRVIVLDIETTGLNADFDRIVDLGVVEYLDGEVELEYTKSFGGGFSMGASRIHGIDDESRLGLETFEECADKISAYLEGSIIVTHNGKKFDIPMIRAKLKDAGFALKNIKQIDTYLLAKRLKIASKSLKSLCVKYNVAYGEHTGLGDAKSTWEVLLRMADELGVQQLEDLIVKEK